MFDQLRQNSPRLTNSTFILSFCYLGVLISLGLVLVIEVDGRFGFAGVRSELEWNQEVLSGMVNTERGKEITFFR